MVKLMKTKIDHQTHNQKVVVNFVCEKLGAKRLFDPDRPEQKNLISLNGYRYWVSAYTSPFGPMLVTPGTGKEYFFYILLHFCSRVMLVRQMQDDRICIYTVDAHEYIKLALEQEKKKSYKTTWEVINLMQIEPVKMLRYTGEPLLLED
jgi:hypothetical protein